MSTTGSLYTFGDNQKGQLGQGRHSKMHQELPTEVLQINDSVRQVSCGFRHTLVLTSNGVYGFGQNSKHELGLGDSHQASQREFTEPLKLDHLDIHRLVRVSAGGFSAALTDQNQIIIWGTGLFGTFRTPQRVCMDEVRFGDI